MAKIRVFHLAKKLGVQSELILEVLDRLGVEVKSDLSIVDPETAAIVENKLSAALAAERERLEQEQSPEEQASQDSAQDETSEPSDEPSTETVAAEAPAEQASEPTQTDAPAEAVTDGTTSSTADSTESKPSATDEKPTKEPLAAKSESAKPKVSKPPKARQKPRVSPPAAGAAAGSGAGGRKPRVFAAKRTTPIHSIRPPKRERPVVKRAKRPTAGPRKTAGAGPGGPGGFPPANAPRPDSNKFRPSAPPVGRKGKKHRKKKKEPQERQQAVIMTPKAPVELPPVPEEITLSEMVTVKELAEKLNRKSKDVIAKLIPRGVLATINQPLDPDLAVEVAEEFGSLATVQSFEDESLAAGGTVTTEETTPDLGLEVGELDETRPPVVTVMGHVDHGKTSLLDAIREANVVDREHGGITQHIGAYQVDAGPRKITFLDTPGHEAFTLMRARGAKATDIVVLVVAADDGVKPQTIEAIDHAKAADVPLVVAINKMDRPEANPDRVKQQLTEHELVVEEYGGDVVSCLVSAKKQEGLDQLLEMINLVADLQEIKANSSNPARGIILEAKVDKARGIVADVLIQDGTLRTGDAFIAGNTHGKVRAMIDEHGQRIESAGPSTPVEIMGLNGEPSAGDTLQAVSDEARARQIASFRSEKEREATLQQSSRRTLEQLAQEINQGDIKELPILLKADVQGSIEALQKSLADLPSEKVKVNVLRASTGAISQADVALAAASNAIIVGFNVRPDRTTAEIAKKEKIEIRLYSIIYDMIEDIQKAMLGMLDAIEREVILGTAEVRDTFKVPKIGVVAGCYVTDGKVQRNAEVRLLRDNVVIYTGKVGSLRRFKEDVAEVKNGYECGIGIAGYNDIKVNDSIEFFTKEEVAVESLS